MTVGLNRNDISLNVESRFPVMLEMIHFQYSVRQQKLLALLTMIASLIILMPHMIVIPECNNNYKPNYFQY